MKADPHDMSARNDAGGQGLSALLATAALATGRQEQPDTILIPVGPGKDGKTMVSLDLMSSVWGSGFGPCPSKMLGNSSRGVVSSSTKCG